MSNGKAGPLRRPAQRMIDTARLQATSPACRRASSGARSDRGAPGQAFRVDPWVKEAGAALAGNGCTCIIEGGRVFERGGVAFSQVSGAALPASATAKRPELAGRAFAAMGVSLVLHPENPYCPTAHMNVRALIATRPMPSPRGGLAAAWI
jgi:coproporphyrinogen III oxidase